VKSTWWTLKDSCRNLGRYILTTVLKYVVICELSILWSYIVLFIFIFITINNLNLYNLQNNIFK